MKSGSAGACCVQYPFIGSTPECTAGVNKADCTKGAGTGVASLWCPADGGTGGRRLLRAEQDDDAEAEVDTEEQEEAKVKLMEEELS